MSLKNKEGGSRSRPWNLQTVMPSWHLWKKGKKKWKENFRGRTSDNHTVLGCPSEEFHIQQNCPALAPLLCSVTGSEQLGEVWPWRRPQWTCQSIMSPQLIFLKEIRVVHLHGQHSIKHTHQPFWNKVTVFWGECVGISTYLE